MKTAMNISIQVEGQTIDLRIPRFVTLEQLKPLLTDALQTMNINLPYQWRLGVVDKNISISPHITLDKYPLSDGEQFEIIAVQQ